MVWLLVGGASGCASDPIGDARRYTEIVSNPDRTLADCDALMSIDLRGDCALAVVARAPQPETLCPAVVAGLWREECWFIAAEAVNRTGDSVGAAALCAKAGRFRMDCAQHLWQTPVHQLIHSRGAAGFQEALPEAEQLYATWAPVLEEQTDFTERFWAKFFGNGFEGQGMPVSTHWCQPLPPAHQQRCGAAAAAFLARELGPAVEQSGRLADFCRLEEPGTTEVSPWIAAEPDPVLDAAIIARQLDICLNAPGAPGRVGP